MSVIEQEKQEATVTVETETDPIDEAFCKLHDLVANGNWCRDYLYSFEDKHCIHGLIQAHL